jgi:hypothetical protein
LNARVIPIYPADNGPDVPPPDDGSRLRQPPHSLEAEQGILGAILQWPHEVIPVAAELLKAADFYSHPHRLIYAAACDVSASGSEVDMITVFEALQERGQAQDAGGLAYLNALTQGVVTSRGARRYAKLVAERATLRALIAASDELATAAFNPQGRRVTDLLDEAKLALGRIETRSKHGGQKMPLMCLEDLRQQSDQVRWLVKNVLPAEAVGMMFGGSGTFKSFIALDAALHVAHGLPWMGRRTNKGPVLYIAAEGGAGLWARVDAWHRARKLEYGGIDFRVLPAAINLAQDAWRVVDAAQLVSHTPALVVVDTLSQTYAGEENSAQEMAGYLRELGTRFRDLWRCAVLLIHHSGHSATERPRGSSAIRANLDYMLGVFRDEKEMLATVSCAKQKDGDTFSDVTFQMRVLELGVDSDGDRITSLVARHLSAQHEVEEAQADEQKAGRGGKRSLLITLAQNGMKYEALRKAFYEDCGLTSPDAQRQAFHRALNAAKKAGALEVAEGYILILGGSK